MQGLPHPEVAAQLQRICPAASKAARRGVEKPRCRFQQRGLQPPNEVPCALRLHDALDAAGDGLLPAVEALHRDEDAVALDFRVAQVAEGEARLRVSDGAGFVVVGDGFEVAHRHRHAARVRGEADEFLAVLRQNDRLEDVEAAQPANLRLDHARLRDGHHEALGHDVVAEMRKGVPILLKDVAEVKFGKQVMRGDAG